MKSLEHICQAVIDFEMAFANSSVKLCCRDGVKRSVGGVREDGVDNEVANSGQAKSKIAQLRIVAYCCLKT